MSRLLTVSTLLGVSAAGFSASPALAVEPSEAAHFSQERAISVQQAATRLGWQEKASELSVRARVALGGNFGGVWIDVNSQDRVKLGVAGGDDTTMEAARRAVVHVGLQDGTDIVRVARSERTLNEAVRWLSDRLEQANRGSGEPLLAGVATDANVAELTLPASDTLSTDQHALLAEARTRLGTALRLGRYEGRLTDDRDCTNAPYNPPPLYCNAPLRGGIKIFGSTGGGCTAAFLARSRMDQKLYQFTAGHCRRDGAGWHTRFYSGGSVHRIGPFHAAVHDSRGDAGILRVNNVSGWYPRAWVFVTASADTTRNEAYRIVSDSDSLVGQRVCITGAARGASDCGTVQYVNRTVGGVRGLVQANYCRTDGDSGGPIYAGNSARGLHKAGSGCVGYYQPIRMAENLMNVNVAQG